MLDPYLMADPVAYVVEKYKEEVCARRAAERLLTGQTEAEQEAARKALQKMADLERGRKKLAVE